MCDRCAELEERLVQVTEAFNPPVKFDRLLRLTDTEGEMLALLLRRPHWTKAALYTVMYGMRLDPPEEKIIDVYICKIRAKVKRHGIKIDTVWGDGWRVDRDNRERIESYILGRRDVVDLPAWPWSESGRIAVKISVA